jgi:hypothetical protein
MASFYFAKNTTGRVAFSSVGLQAYLDSVFPLFVRNTLKPRILSRVTKIEVRVLNLRNK